MMLVNKALQRLAQSAVCLCLLAPSISQAQSEAMAMLERMGVAAKTLNYDGVFTYQTGRKVQSIRIIHRSNEHGEVERLLSLDGAAREMVRTNDHVTCIFPEGKRINVDRRPLGRGFPSDLLNRMSSAAPYYTLSIDGTGRVADRKAKKLAVTPVDHYRYGYRLWMDVETDLLLQSELLATKEQVLEKFTFSSINLNVDIPEVALQPQIEGQQLSWNRNRTEPVQEVAVMTKQAPINEDWFVTWLPDGFALVAEQSRRKAEDNAVVEQRVYSDGLSSVSVFVEEKKAEQHFEGVSKMGAINAFGMIADAHYITVVGQVPAETVEKIGHAIQFVDDE